MARYTDDELLKIVGEQRKLSIGFGEGDSELTDAREKALNYYKGEMNDVPAMANRSATVDMAISEAIDTALPDIVEIFIGGDDIANFEPIDQDDEQQSRDESDYVRRVVLSENPGFITFNTAFKDALLTRTGLFHWWWEEDETEETEDFNGPPEEAPVAYQNAIAAGAEVGEVTQNDDGTVSFTATLKSLNAKVCIKAVPPEDFSVAQDTVILKDTAYCVLRDRPRVQDLIARGVDPEIARELKTYAQGNQQISQARDQAGEMTLMRGEATGDLRQVEVRAHYVRLAMEDDELTVWRIVTDSEERVLIEPPEEVGSIPFGAITPYLNPHRFYGESVADKLFEIQRVKTTLRRMHLDSGYFALNQRMEVNMSMANEFTIADLLRNEPSMPIRTNASGAVLPISSPGLSFNALEALEYESTVGEQRTGIVRNAQGLNPDTLHDTARGAMQLISAAQKRIRYIARVFAETGVKDLFLGVHGLLRHGYGQKTEGARRKDPQFKVGKEWKTVKPGEWRERTALDVGIGSAGREHDMAAMGQIMQAQAEMLAAGLGGVVVKPSNIYNAAKRFAQAADQKNPELFFSDPADAPPQPPKPDPEMAKAQAQMQLEQQKAQSSAQLEQAKAQATLQLEQAKHEASSQQLAEQSQNDSAMAVTKMQAEMELKRYQIDQELQLKREQLGAELALKRELGLLQARVTHETGMAKVNASTSQVKPGGEPG